MNRKRTALAALLLAAATGAYAQVKIEQPWARPTVEGQMAGGAFLKIQNVGGADRLLSASSSAAAMVQLHTMSVEGNVMKMREVETIELPAGKTVELKPGGLHIMLMGLKAPLKAGSGVPLTLKFEKAGAVTVNLTVAAQAP
jgi:copper(I)-binding protein